MKRVVAVILAAGKSTRIKSPVTKLLHPLADKPVIRWVVDACKGCGISRIILVVGHQSDRIKEVLGMEYEYVLQLEALGTGHALMQAEKVLKGYDGDLLVLAGDAPFVNPEILEKLIEHHRKTSSNATILTGRLEDPASYGRIVRNAKGVVERIVEAKDANSEELSIDEVNSGIYCFDAPSILPLLHLIDNKNAKHEYLLTDVIKIAREHNLKVETFVSPDPNIVRGVNTEGDFEIARKLLTKD